MRYRLTNANNTMSFDLRPGALMIVGRAHIPWRHALQADEREQHDVVSL
jgi:hypothetical protein